MQPELLYEDEHYLVINKPSGLLSIPDRHNPAIPSATGWLRHRYPSVFIIHRLDKETSGILCFAKDEETHRYTSQLFEHREVDKQYSGIVYGVPEQESGLIEAPIMEHPVIKGKMIIHQKQGKPSQTRYRVVETFGLFSFVQFEILTGRTHQIRIHMANMGHPIVCDPLYGNEAPVFLSQLKKNFKLSKTEEEERPILHRLALHAARLNFQTAANTMIDIEAPLPKDMNAFLNQCRKWLKQ